MWPASAWAVGALLQAVLSVSDLLGLPVWRLGLRTVVSFAPSVAPGQALAVQALLASAVAVAAGVTISRFGAAWVALAGAAALLPPALTGHAAGAGNHQIAVTALALGVLAVSVWLGCLVVLVVVRPPHLVPEMARQFSRLALGCWQLASSNLTIGELAPDLGFLCRGGGM